MSPDGWLIVVSAIGVGMLMPLVIRFRFIGHDRVGGVQALHVIPTSRLGGAMLAGTYLAVAAVARLLGANALAGALPLALAVLPVLLVGVSEDVALHIRPRYRLLAAVASAALASAFAGGTVSRIDFEMIDRLLPYAWVALPLTWFMVAGACNAVNLIDGANGLAAGSAVIMFGGIALMASASGDAATLAPALAMIAVLAAFLCWNYPRGKVFLGDAGAYFVGFMYAELAIQLVARNDQVSPWYVVLLAGYPIIDTLFAMYRRLLQGRPLMAPDAMHLHSLVFRRVAIPAERRACGARTGTPLGDEGRQRANARVAPRLWVHGALCFALAVQFHDNTPALVACLVAYAAFYVMRYRSLVAFGRRPRPKLAPLEQGADAAE
jgi:UDP-N-acetylmuramyl pentapeptide phosphotransferase/UDP-N-acetylglucosamine-1-phosphate transferase